MWEYRASFVKAIDGDTIDVIIDVGFHTFKNERLRLLNINTPEMKGDTLIQAKEAKRFTEYWCKGAAMIRDHTEWPLIVTTSKSDAFGRFLAVVKDHDNRCLNDELLEAGHAVKDIR